MKKILFIFSVLLIALAVIAGPNDRTRPTVSATALGVGADQTYVTLGGGLGDTLVVSDTLQHVLYVDHTGQLQVYFSTYYQKIGAATATITLNYYQSNDGINWYTLKKGKNQGAYTKSVSVTASAYASTSMLLDTCVLEGRFLKKQYITSSTASVKVKITDKAKINIK